MRGAGAEWQESAAAAALTAETAAQTYSCCLMPFLCWTRLGVNKLRPIIAWIYTDHWLVVYFCFRTEMLSTRRVNARGQDNKHTEMVNKFKSCVAGANYRDNVIIFIPLPCVFSFIGMDNVSPCSVIELPDCSTSTSFSHSSNSHSQNVSFIFHFHPSRVQSQALRTRLNSSLCTLWLNNGSQDEEEGY